MYKWNLCLDYIYGVGLKIQVNDQGYGHSKHVTKVRPVNVMFSGFFKFVIYLC